MDTLLQDLRFGTRMLLKSPAFTLIAITTLALGIGANAAMFSVVRAVLLRPLPFKDADRIVYVWETDLKNGIPRDIPSPADFLDWREQNHSFEMMSATRTWFYTLTGKEEPEQVMGVRASANFFDLLGVRPEIGRTFHSDEDEAGRDQVVILSHRLWQRRFGGDRNLPGKTIDIDGRPFTVIGVLPPDFNLYGDQRQDDLWMPFVMNRSELKRDDFSILAFARLKKDTTLGQAQTEMNGIAQHMAQAYPATHRDRGVQVLTMQESQALTIRPALLMLMAAAGFVLLIACANVSNLCLARASSRQKEFAIRASLGASRSRLIWQSLTESILLSVLGAVAGLLLAWNCLYALRAAVKIDPRGLPRSDWMTVDYQVLGITVVLSLLTGVIFGLWPALQASNISLNNALKEKGKSSSRASGNVLVISEMALVMILLVGAGLMLRSFKNVLDVSPGFKPENVLTMQVWLPESMYPQQHQVIEYCRETLSHIRAIPKVQAASSISFLPLSGIGDSTGIVIEGRAPNNETTPLAQYHVIDPDYFHTIGIPLLKGRAFVDQDSTSPEGLVVISETMARQYWPNEDPIGNRIHTIFPETNTPWRPKAINGWLTIIGVVGDVNEYALDRTPAPQIYLPYWQAPSRLMGVVIRASSDPLMLSATIRRELLTVNRNQPVTEVKTMEQIISQSVFRRRFNLSLLGIFAATALILATVGIYGVMSYTVSQRSHEIGIRMALGAQALDVLNLVLKQGMKPAIIGIVTGLTGAFALTRLMVSLLYKTSATDPLTFAFVAFLLAGVALVACYIPARRAQKANPMVVLRCE